jgi:hypothetical protein
MSSGLHRCEEFFAVEIQKPNVGTSNGMSVGYIVVSGDGCAVARPYCVRSKENPVYTLKRRDRIGIDDTETGFVIEACREHRRDADLLDKVRRCSHGMAGRRFQAE